MVFQTLYFLVDLYCVGRLGTDGGRGGRPRRQPDVLRAGADADAGRRHDHADVARGRPQGPRPRAASCSTSRRCCRWCVGAVFFVVAMALRVAYAHGAGGRSRDGAARAGEYLLWFIPAMAVQFAMVAMAAALRGIGNFKPGMIVQSATVVMNMVLAPLLIFGWGTGHPLGVAGAAIASFVAIVVGVSGSDATSSPATAYLEFVPARMAPRLGDVGADAEDRACRPARSSR